MSHAIFLRLRSGVEVLRASAPHMVPFYLGEPTPRPDPLASGEAVGHRLRDCFIYDRMAQRPAVLETLFSYCSAFINPIRNRQS